MDLFEKTLSCKEVYRGRIFSVENVQVSLPDGKTSTRDIVRHNGAVAIVAITNDNKIVLTEQFRKPIDKVLIEIPAGKLEKGENEKSCAIRELEEETGYKCGKIVFLSKIIMAPGFADEYISIFFAMDLENGSKSCDEDEFINTYEYSLHEINEMINQGKIYDSKTICGIKLYESYIKNKKDRIG